jgi:hypothetical protein
MTKEERKEYNKLYYLNNKETIIKQTQQYAESLGYNNEIGNRNKSNS